MNRPKLEPVQDVKQRRDAALAQLVGSIPYIRRLGVNFDPRGGELTANMPFSESLIGHPFLPAIHGGATGAFMHITAFMEHVWSTVWVHIAYLRPAAPAFERG